MRAAGALGVVMLAGAMVAYGVRGGTHVVPSAGALVRAASDVRAPEGVRVRVEVLNATRVRGLARRATFFLRDRGFDVVESGNAGELRDSTLVIDRTGHAAWAALVARAMGPGATVAARPDSSHYVDVTVLIGRSWRPPAEPFHP
jgi:hypothetical protein